MSDKFKDDYPDMYKKFLEMNRALAKLMHKTHTVDPKLVDELPEADELPNLLEWD